MTSFLHPTPMTIPLFTVVNIPIETILKDAYVFFIFAHYTTDTPDACNNSTSLSSIYSDKLINSDNSP